MGGGRAGLRSKGGRANGREEATKAGFTVSTLSYRLILVLLKEDPSTIHIQLCPLICSQLCWRRVERMQACRKHGWTRLCSRGLAGVWLVCEGWGLAPSCLWVAGAGWKERSTNHKTALPLAHALDIVSKAGFLPTGVSTAYGTQREITILSCARQGMSWNFNPARIRQLDTFPPLRVYLPPEVIQLESTEHLVSRSRGTRGKMLVRGPRVQGTVCPRSPAPWTFRIEWGWATLPLPSHCFQISSNRSLEDAQLNCMKKGDQRRKNRLGVRER